MRKSCHGCKRFQASAYAAPPPGNRSTTRTQGTSPYQVIGVDYAGPIRYRVFKQREGKAYLLLYACSLTRGTCLDLLPNSETAKCLKSLKQFIARGGRPERIYSDNSRTFVGAANSFRALMEDDDCKYSSPSIRLNGNSEPRALVGRVVRTIDRSCQVNPKQGNRECRTAVERIKRRSTGRRDHA